MYQQLSKLLLLTKLCQQRFPNEGHPTLLALSFRAITLWVMGTKSVMIAALIALYDCNIPNSARSSLNNGAQSKY